MIKEENPDKILAFCFPGQGSQYVGMGKDIYEKYDLKDLYKRAEQALGIDLKKISFFGPREKLTLTENAQPAILLDSVVKFYILRENLSPDIAVGHSLGEYSALVCAKVISLEDGLRLVRKRGKYMQEAVLPGKGAMLAIIGSEPDEIQRVCNDVNGIVEIANFNSPQQIVISGRKESLKKVGKKVEKRGAKVIQLAVSAPFHSSLMKPAEDKLKERIEKVKFDSPQFPIISTVSGKPELAPDRIKELLKKQITAPVRWMDYVTGLYNLGVSRMIEVGPGSVLTRLSKRMDCQIEAHSFEEVLSNGR